jgi:hypothetical protein
MVFRKFAKEHFRIVFENKILRIVRATSVRGEYVIGQIVLSFVYSFYGE